MIKEWFAKQRMKATVSQVFKSGDMGVTYSYSQGQNTGKIYPKIRSVKFNYDQKTVTCYFSLPTGMDPKEIKKKTYCFEQVFGQRIEISGKVKEFKLTVFVGDKEKKINYNYDEILAVIEREKFTIPIVAGYDSAGKLLMYDATNNPNLLIFGEPGSGKSSILHVIISTLIQFYSADEIQFYMADFKQSELVLYEDVDHVMNVSYQVKAFAPVLKHLKSELEKRGTLLRGHRVRHVNKLPKDKKPPHIVLVVDEFVMIKDDEIMSNLLQIASLGRAYGIYLILSMQRPSHKILSTDVRGVLSVRMGFRTVDLRNAMIGDTPGSEKISADEPGKFLLSLNELIELRAPYLSEDEVEKIMEAYKSGKPKQMFTDQIKPSEKTIDLKEIEKDVFGVLPE
ncbi:FtsK/SpoIIIE domain-containing protein [Neobacillus jeddahensis]|uniref:FtsK/SpoIIIE domain-containing protein n=1 Tax=Neobacillus jeddahensis TaxID=1461580 RepID=UPI0005AAC917|nr:FtsK/SpoIIIE domain-containing protein [Neobacillus jeddahensis]